MMSDLSRLFLTDDSHQALRIRRFALAVSGYLVLLAMLFLTQSSGFMREIDLPGMTLIAFLLLATNAVIYLMFLTGINKKFKDPSLTIPQLLVGIVFMTVVAYFSSSNVRGVNLVVYILIFVFGTFRLRLREFFFLAAVTIALYMAAMMLLLRHDPAAVSVNLELLRSFILLVALLWMSVVADYIANLRRKVKRLATHDSLTNLYNRREGFASLDREKAFADRTGLSFAVCMIDLDDFKTVNDTYGHLAGDTVLKEFARVLKENTRDEDYVTRYGGEEFFIIFVNFECRDGNPDCIQRLLNMVRDLKFPEISETLKITASFGVAGYRPSESVDSLVDRADQALYQAKARGKNTIAYDCDPGL
ncbi:MAG: GGDEF domain-containing protein [Desulfosudaceae bacterium]